MERRYEKETGHKLAPISEVTFHVKEVNTSSRTVVIEYPDRSVENFSRSRVVLAPASNVTEEVQEAIRPLTINEVILDYPAPEDFNQTHIHQQSEKPSGQLPRAWEMNDQEQPQVDNAVNSRKELEDTPGEYVIDDIVDWKINKSRRNRYVKYGENLYKVRWHGFGPEEDTWEPTHHLPRSKIIMFYRKPKQPIPSDINSAVNG